MGIQAAILYKDSALCYPSSPAVQGQYPMGFPAALLYKDSALCAS